MPTHLLQAALVSSCLCDGKVVGGHLCPTGMGASNGGLGADSMQWDVMRSSIEVVSYFERLASGR